MRFGQRKRERESGFLSSSCETWSEDGSVKERRNGGNVKLSHPFLGQAEKVTEIKAGRDREWEAEIVKRSGSKKKRVTECAVSISRSLKQWEREQASLLFTAIADKTQPLVWNGWRRLNEMFWKMAGKTANQQEKGTARSLTAPCSPLRASAPLRKRRDRI